MTRWTAIILTIRCIVAVALRVIAQGGIADAVGVGVTVAVATICGGFTAAVAHIDLGALAGVISVAFVAGTLTGALTTATSTTGAGRGGAVTVAILSGGAGAATAYILAATGRWDVATAARASTRVCARTYRGSRAVRSTALAGCGWRVAFCASAVVAGAAATGAVAIRVGGSTGTTLGVLAGASAAIAQVFADAAATVAGGWRGIAIARATAC